MAEPMHDADFDPDAAEPESAVQALLRQANACIAAKDVPGALPLFARARLLPDAPARAWVEAVPHLPPDDAAALLADAVRRFPRNPRARSEGARLAERLGRWPDAAAEWTAFIDLDPERWWGYTGLARARHRLGQDEEAARAYEAAAARFPAEPQVRREAAQFLAARGAPEAALPHWDALIALAPGQWAGYRSRAAALAAAGRDDEAASFIETAAVRFPGNAEALHDFARLMERRGAWHRAEEAWRFFIAVMPRFDWAFLALARTLRETERGGEAAEIIRDALGRFPSSPRLAAEAAAIAEEDGGAAAALDLWRRAAGLESEGPGTGMRFAQALHRSGAGEEAAAVLHGLAARFSSDPAPVEAAGMLALGRGDHAEALRLLQDGLARFPKAGRFRERIHEVQLRAADAGAPPAAEPVPAAENDDRALLMQFESLGGGGRGCEFGIFQRECGAEPLGLLRWSDIGPDELTEALNARFDGVGEPEFTELFVPEDGDRREYWMRDTRWHMAMRSFVPADEVPFEAMRERVAKRMGFLREKLIADLEAGAKLFVYRNIKRNLTDAELVRLHAACRSYGDTTLFYMRYADAGHAPGSVVRAGVGLLVGYIDHFSHTPDTDEYIGNPTPALLRLCRTAHALWMETRSG